MTTIGYATLQIIPSLQGVTEAIEKQVQGKVVNVTIAPKVDQKVTERVAKQTRDTVEKQTKQVTVEPKVDQAAAKKAGKQAGKTVSDEMATTVKSSAGKEAAKALIDGLADGVKREMPRGGVAEVFVDGLADGIKQGIDGVGIGGQVVTTISNGVKSRNLGGTIRDAVVPAMQNIGNEIRSSASTWAGGIADSLRSGDIKGATNEIGETVRNTTSLISGIGSTFGLQLDGVREFGDTAATTLSDVGGDIQDVITTATEINDTFNTAGNLLEQVLPGKAGTGAAKIADALGKIAVPAWLTYLTADAGNKIANDIAGTDYGVLETLQQGATAPIRISGEIFGTPVPDWANPYVTNRLPTIFGDQGPTGKTQRERRGYGTGGYTGSMPVDKIAGVVHGGEYVINAPSTKNLENAYPGLLSYLNNQGDLPFGQGNFNPGILIDTSNVSADEPRPSKSSGLAGGGGWFGDPSTNRFNLPGYKGGGKVELGNISGPGITTLEQQSMWDAIRNKFPAAVLNSATRTIMTEGHPDFHNAGRAIDIGGPNMGAIASWIASTYPDSLELIHSPFGHNIKNGKNVGDGMAFYGANLMAAHRNHVHWALGKSAMLSTGSMLPALGLDSSTAAIVASPEADANSSAATSSTSLMNVPGSLSELAGMYGDQIGSISPVVSPDGKTESLSKIGDAAGQFASGQVSSALGAFGINDAPGWLKGLSTLANGIKIGGGPGGAAAGGANTASPLSAAESAISTASNAALSTVGGILGGPHMGSGQAPGPQVVYNIQTTDIEPAYLASQRQEKERAAANLARF